MKSCLRKLPALAPGLPKRVDVCWLPPNNPADAEVFVPNP